MRPIKLAALVLALAVLAGCVDQAPVTQAPAESAEAPSPYPHIDPTKPYTEVDANEAKAIIDSLDVVVVDSTPGTVFDTAAIAAVQRWRFRPVLVDGEPVSARAKVHIEFNLPEA